MVHDLDDGDDRGDFIVAKVGAGHAWFPQRCCIPEPKPKPAIRLYDRVRDLAGREGVVAQFSFFAGVGVRIDGDGDEGALYWYSGKNLVLLARPTWTPVETNQ